MAGRPRARARGRDGRPRSTSPLRRSRSPAGEVDARHERIDLRHAALRADGQRVLVVHARPPDPDDTSPSGRSSAHRSRSPRSTPSSSFSATSARNRFGVSVTGGKLPAEGGCRYLGTGADRDPLRAERRGQPGLDHRRRGPDRTCCSCPGSSPTSSTCGTTPGWPASSNGCAAFARVILMDRRGTGLSDPLDGALHAGGRGRADVLAVMDAAGSDSRRPPRLPDRRAARDQGRRRRAPSACARSCSTPPSRARCRAPGYDWANDAGERSAALRPHGRALGHGRDARRDRARARAGDVRLRAWLARLERLSSSPGELRRAGRAARRTSTSAPQLADAARPDADPAPHRRPPRSTSRHSRYLAEHIPGARLVELDGRRQPAERRRQRRAARRDRGVPHRRPARHERSARC